MGSRSLVERTPERLAEWHSFQRRRRIGSAGLGNQLQPIRSGSIGVRRSLGQAGGTIGGGRAGCACASCSVAVVVLANMVKMIQRYRCIVLTSVRLLTLSRITYTSHPRSARGLSCTVPPTQKPTAGRRRAARWSKEVGELSCA